MAALVERAKQALHVGPQAFLPSCLDAQEATLRELDVFAPSLADMLETLRRFEAATAGAAAARQC